MPTEKEKWLKFQFKAPFMLHADFESILKPVDEGYRDKINTTKADRKGKTPHTEKINTHIRSRWSVHSTFAYGDVPNPLKSFVYEIEIEDFYRDIA